MSLCFLSSGRKELLQMATVLWQSTGIPFLKGSLENLSPLEQGIGDDLGLFYFVPLIAKTFQISVEQALWWWDTSIVVLGSIIALTGFWRFTSHKFGYFVSLLGVSAQAGFAWWVGNVYGISFFPLCFLPWTFIFSEKKIQPLFFLWCFIVGIVGAFSNSMRMQSGLALLCATLIIMAVQRKNIKQVILSLMIIAAGYGGYQTWFSSIIKQCDRYLKMHGIVKDESLPHHVLWHTIYVGLGFITNDLGIYYGDRCSAEKLSEKKCNADYCSEEYDAALRQEVFYLVRHKPHHVLRVLFAKLGILFFYLLLFANLGLICAWMYRKPFFIDLSYAIALVITALPALLTAPLLPYLVGFFTVATFFGIHSLLFALQNGLLRDSWVWLRTFFKKRSVESP